MPAIALLQPNHSGAPIHVGRWVDTPSAQGVEGKKVSAKAQEVYRHWSERAEVLVMRLEAVDELPHERTLPPPNREFYVKTQYVYAGKGLPRRIDLDDE